MISRGRRKGLKYEGLIIFIIFLFFPFLTYSLPEGEEVVVGVASFDRPSENTLKITTPSDKVIVNYNSFSIAQQEAVNFSQPSADSVALNRVVGIDPSSIMGTLSANGRIFLVNPNGVVFGPNSRVDVAALVASTLNISNEDFLSGNYRFSKSGNNSYVINQGNITVKNGGYVCLLSAAVENSGTIRADLGTVILASGEKMTLALDDLNEVSVVVDEAVKETVFGPDGKRLDSAIKNTGTISANGGKVILTAKVLNDVFDYAINNSGIIEAKSVINKNGIVELIAEGAPIINTRKIETDQLRVEAVNGDFINKGEIISEEITGNINIKSLNIYNTGVISAIDHISLNADDTIAACIPGELPTISGPLAIIQASRVNIKARQFGLSDVPLNINSTNIHITRSAGDIEILESTGIGTNVLLRGPPSGFGAIVYNKEANLTLDASRVVISAANPSYLYGNITFYNLNVSVQDKEIYFEAGRTYTFKGATSIIGAPDIGPEEFFIKLRSSETGKSWYLDLKTDNYTLERVNVSDAYAFGKVIIPIGVDSGNNVNFEIDPTWDGEGATNNWSDATNWSGNTLPTSTTDATFNATSTKDSIVDAGFGGTIRDLSINAGYTGTITFNRSLSVRDFSQAAGTVNLGSQTLSVSRNFSVSGGTFNAGSAAISVENNFTISGTGAFDEGTSTVTFSGGAATINVLTTETFYNLTFNATAAKTVSSGDTLIVTRTLTLTNGSINTGTVSAMGDISQASTFDAGTGDLLIEGTANQTFTGNATTTTGDLPDLTINKTGGTLTLSGTIRTSGQGAGAWTYIAGTVDATTNDSLVVFNGANTIDGQGTSSTMAFDNVEFTGGTSTLAGNFDVDGNLTISAGTLNTSGSDYNVNVAGNWSNAGTFTSNDSAVTLDGSSNSTVDTGGVAAGDDFETLVISKSGTAVVSLINNNLDVDGTLTINSGVLSLNGRNITTTTTFVNNGTLRLQGQETVSWTVNDTDSGTWEYVGRNIAETITLKDFGATDYFNLTINDTNANKATFSSGAAKVIAGAFGVSSGTYNANGQSTTVAALTTVNGGTYQASTATQTFNGGLTISSGTFTGSTGTVDVNGDVTISGTGTLTAPSGTFTVSGTWAKTGSTFNAGGGTVTFDGTSAGKTITSGGASFNNITFNGVGGGWTLQDDLDVNGNLTLTNGTLNLNGKTITLAGNFSNNATFNHNSGRVIFDGAGISTVSGSTTFFNFTSTTAGKQLTFTAGTTQTIAGTLTLTGAPGNLIVLRSSSSGNQWNINPQGSRSVSYVDVKDSNNTNTTVITAATSKDSGNNTGWYLVDHFTITGSARQTAGVSNQLTITAIDGSGGTSTSFNGDKSLTFSGANSISSFTPTVTDKNATAVNFNTAATITFTNGASSAGASMILYKAENITVNVSDGTSNSNSGFGLAVTVNPANADSLNFKQQPSNANSGSLISPSVIVEIRDAFTNIVTTDNATSVTISIQTNPSGGVLSGTLTRVASGGIVTFDNLSINKPGTGYTVSASSGVLTGQTSASFDIISNFIEEQLSAVSILRFLLPDIRILEQYQFNSFDILGGAVYLYHPLVVVDMVGFDEFILEEGAYQFIDGAINILDHDGLLPVLQEQKNKK